MASKSATLRIGDITSRLSSRKSDYPNYSRVEITFSDAYIPELMEEHGWTEEDADSLDTQLFGRLSELEAVIHQEDREFFIVDIPAEKSSEPVKDVYQALEKMISEAPYTSEKIVELKEQAEETQGKAEAVQLERKAQARTDSTLLRGYLRDSEAVFGHRGYCIVEMASLKRLSALSYEEESFLGKEHRKQITKPGMVLVDVSLMGEPFFHFYHSAVNYRQPYASVVEEAIKQLATSPDEIVKISHHINSTTGDSEKIRMLCTKDLAEKIGSYFSQTFPHLTPLREDAV